MNEQLPYRFVIGPAELVPTHAGSEAKMLTIAACILSGIVVLGFYGYVFSHLYSEHRKMKRLEKHLADHLSKIGQRREPNAKSAVKPQPRKSSGSFRVEALVNVGVTVAGLTAMFAELEILNRLLSTSH